MSGPERAAAGPNGPSGDAPAGGGSETGGRRRGWRRALGLVAGVLLIFVVIPGAGLAWVARDLPAEIFAGAARQEPAVILEAADGTLIGRRGLLRAEPVVRSKLPHHLVHAVLAIEDRRFYEHHGLDFLGIARAAWRNYRAGEVVEGGSTITQQLSKVLYLEPDRTIKRKLQEAVIALWLEFRLTKDEILTRYLDNVYFGAGAVGLGAAALVYFDKTPSELTLAESAMLAGLIRAPSKLNPLSDPEAAQERASVVLESMVDAGYLTRDAALEAALAPAVPYPGAASTGAGSWFADWIYDQAMEMAGPLLGSVRVRTTLRPELQALAERVVTEALAGAGDQRAGEAALVAMTHDGAVVAMVGGRDYGESQFNRAAQALRQPGSAFKPFVYLAALREGWRLDDTLLDAPLEIDGWRPRNYSGRYYGRVPLQEAFARSLNTATVRLAQQVGIERVIAAARDLGIDAELESNPGLALGTSGVSPLDLTGAFASVAAGRMPVQPWGVAGLIPADGSARIVRGARPETRPLDHRDELVRLLEAVVSGGTGRRAALEGFTAGKTGTSQNHRDAWFIGFTDRLVAGVWVGNDDDSPMRGVAGGGLPARVWQAFMSEATGLAPLAVAPPPSQSRAERAGGSGLPAAEQRTETASEAAAPTTRGPTDATSSEGTAAPVATTAPQPAARPLANEPAAEAGGAARAVPAVERSRSATPARSGAKMKGKGKAKRKAKPKKRKAKGKGRGRGKGRKK